MSSQICSEIKWPLVGTFRTGENFARHWTEILDFFILFVCEWMWVLSWVNIEQFLKEKKEKTLCAKLLNPLLLTDMSRERKEICCSYNISFQAQKQFRWNWDSFSREYAMKMLSALQLYGATWARSTKNVKKPQSQMCESCRKAWFKIFAKQNRNIFGFSHTFDSQILSYKICFNKQTNLK